MRTGTVVWNARKSLWNFALLVGALTLGPLTATPSAVAAGALSTAFILCVGHSVGMHRLLIHQSFVAPRPLAYALVTLGTLVGMGGPLTLLRLHDTRDALQNERACHPFFGDQAGLLQDFWWNLHCRFAFDAPFVARAVPRVTEDPYYRWLDRRWPWVLAAFAAGCFALGGLPALVWCTLVRMAVSLTGHWFVGWLTHAPTASRQRYTNRGSAIQGVNSALFGTLSMGEGFHNNHHAFPRSARMGIRRGQVDPGYLVIRALELLGLATQVLRPGLSTRARMARRTATSAA